MKPGDYKTEAELCLAFAAVATAAGWTVYNETAGWDQLLVHSSGEQIGVQAKLRPNLKVLYQALRLRGTGPDWRCVLVGQNDAAFLNLCHELKLLCAFPSYRGDQSICFPDLQHCSDRRWIVAGRHTLPTYMPDVPAGVPCPVRLTPWKIKAIRLCAVLRSRGHLTPADFKAHKVWRQRWFIGKTRWLQAVRRGIYVAAPGQKLPDEDHPTVAAQIRAELAAAGVLA